MYSAGIDFAHEARNKPRSSQQATKRPYADLTASHFPGQRKLSLAISTFPGDTCSDHQITDEDGPRVLSTGMCD